MGEIADNPFAEEFLRKSERIRRMEATRRAEAVFFDKIMSLAAQLAAQEIAKLMNFKGATFDDVVYFAARKRLGAYLAENPEIKSAIFTANANSPDKAVQGLSSVVLESYRRDPRSFLRPEITVK